jgi:hypothetical protein
LLPIADGSSNHGQAIMALDSAQHVLEIYDSRFDNPNVFIEYPTDLNCPTACADSRTLIAVPTGLADDGDRMAHEMGHVLQMIEFGQDYLRGPCGESWNMTSTENDSCATTEGWAAYVAAVAWWDPGNTGSRPLFSGTGVETATPIKAACDDNRGVPGQAARAFWDLDDANDEVGVGVAAGSDDVSTLSTLSMSAGWDAFPDGTGNHDDYENDDHGVNVKDYNYNYDVNNETFFDHNCISLQTSN